MPSWLQSLLIVVVCFAGVALIARYNHVRNRDAGGGWQYIYWQPWRKWLIGIILVPFLLYVLWLTALVKGWL